MKQLFIFSSGKDVYSECFSWYLNHSILTNVGLLFYSEYFDGLLEIFVNSLYNVPHISLKANRDLKSIINQLLYADVPN